MNVTETLASFAVNLKYEDIPQKVVKQAKRCVLDSLGCAVGGYETGLGKTIITAVKEFPGPTQSTIICDGTRVAPNQAAFANTALTNLLDFDDTSEGIGHPGNTAIPSALAVGETVKASGKDFLTAVVLGYEVSTRIGYGIKPTPARNQVIFPMACWQTFAAVTAASKLLGLGKNQTMSAFGIAGRSVPVPSSIAKSFEKPAGWSKVGIATASGNGVLSAFMARRGVPGSQTILECDGLWLMAGSDSYDSDVMTSGLGTEYHIMAVSHKPYPSIAWFHPANDAVASILEEKKLKADDIREIKLKTLGPALKLDYAPRTMHECEFSLPYGIAMVVLREPPGPGWFAEKTVNSKEVSDILRKIKAEEDPEATNLFGSTKGAVQRATVEITTKEGRAFTKRIDSKRGSATRPLTDREIDDKFRDLVVPVLKTDKTKKIIQTVNQLEQVKDLSVLPELMKKEG